MTARITILSACLLLSAGYVAVASKTERVPPREPLAGFPLDIGPWSGQKERDLDPAVLAVLKADEYLNRTYLTRASDLTLTSPGVGLYVGYYGSQRQGDTIHSPLNCLPGSGWWPVSKSYLTIPVGSAESGERTITVNRYVIQKGLEQDVVLYWYQGHGRVVANEYSSKLFMIYDAVRLNRTDAALIRIVSPALGPGPGAEAAASERAVDFAKAMFPLLGRYLPA